MHKEKSAFPQSPGIRARLDYIISAHIPEVKEYTTISQELEHLQGWGLHITQQKSLRSIRSTFKHDRTPVKEIPGIPQLALYDNPITPNIPIDPLFPPHQRPKQPYHLGEDISEIGTGTRFVGIEARDPQY